MDRPGARGRGAALALVTSALSVALVGCTAGTPATVPASAPDGVPASASAVTAPAFTSAFAASTATSATAAPASPPASPPPPAGTPPPGIAAELQAVLDGAVGKDAPGVVARVDLPGWSWSGAAGIAREVPRAPADPSDHARIASVSKVFTAVAILRLAEEGKLSLDDTLDRWLPSEYLARMNEKGFAADRITIRDVLRHRSGIADYDEMGVLIPAQITKPDVPVTTDAAIFDGLDRGPAAYAPGDGFAYSNPGYILLTRIIDAASGTTYEEYLRATILGPLGMSETYLPTDPPVRTVPEPAMHALMQTEPDGPWEDFTDLYMLWDRGSGDIISTVGDLATFHRALREGRIIGADSFAQMRDFLPAEERFSYGMGYQRVPSPALGVALEGHNGGYPGAVTDVFYLPEHDAYITIARNGNLVPVPVLRGLAEVLVRAP